MRTRTFTAALFSGACALFIEPAAGADLSGYAEVGGGGGFYHVNTLGFIAGRGHTEKFFSGAGHLNVAFDSGFYLQFDVEGKRNFTEINIPPGSILGDFKKTST